MLEVERTGNDNEASEAFARWLYHRQGPVELSSAGISLRRVCLIFTGWRRPKRRFC